MRDIVLADFEKHAVNEALAERACTLMVLRLQLMRTVFLKAARAFLVFKNLEGHGDVIKSHAFGTGY